MDINQCQDLVKEALKDSPAALSFIQEYIAYANLVDDIVDETDFQNSRKFLQHTNAAEQLHAHPFFLANVAWLRPIMLIVHNDYADSVEFETNDNEQKKQIADVLRIAAIHVVNAVVYHVAGYDKMRELSPILRYNLWLRHKNENH